MITQKHDLDVTPSGVLPVVNASQYDVGRIIKFYLYNESEVYNIPVGTSVLVNGIKPNGDAFSYSATYTDNVVTVTLTDQMTVIDGEVKCELRFADTLGNDIGTTNFILLVERAPFDASIPISETEIPAIIELARAEQYNAEAWAVGERNGTPVDPTDPTYHNNAKYWSENAQHGSLDNLSDVVISSPVGGQALVYDDVNDEWVNGNVSTVDTLDDLTDVSLVSPTNGQVLTFNNNEWKNESIGVDDLDDIVITNPTDDDGLVYDATAQKWKNKPVVTGDLWVKNGAHNLLPYPYRDGGTQVISGFTLTVNDNGVDKGKMSASGTANESNRFALYVGTLPKNNYKFRFVGSLSGVEVAIYDYVTEHVIDNAGANEDITLTVDATNENHNFLLYIYWSSGSISISGRPLLKLASDPSDDDTPYAMTNGELTDGLSAKADNYIHDESTDSYIFTMKTVNNITQGYVGVSQMKFSPSLGKIFFYALDGTYMGETTYTPAT